jgi:4-hydroxybenzoate polyprenyltransferase
MTEPALFGLTIIPAIVGLVEVAKDLGIPSRMAPAAAVLLGILFGLAQIYAARFTWIPAVCLGIAFGLSACGLYDTARNLLPTPTTPPKSPETSKTAPTLAQNP